MALFSCWPQARREGGGGVVGRDGPDPMRSSAMSVPLLALAHPDEPENSTTTRLFGVATRLADLLRRGQSIRRQEVKRLMEEAFSASDATGNWSMRDAYRSEEHTSELQSLMRISYAVFCLKKKKQ